MKNLKTAAPKKIQNKKRLKPKKQGKKSGNYELIGLGSIILIGLIIYSNSFICTFQFDDVPHIVNNSKIRNIYNIKEWWNSFPNRPLSMFTFALNYHFGKLNVWGYHFINLVIHLINSCLIWWLTLLIFSSPNLKNNPIYKYKNHIALSTALLFVSHPLATESVTYIIQRMASMAAMFYLLSIVLYMTARLADNKSNAKKYFLYAGSLISAIIAVLSKENAATIPLAILLCEFFFIRTKKLKTNLKDYRVVLLLTASIGIVLFVYFKYSSSIIKPLEPDVYSDYRIVTSVNYLFTQFSVITKYIQLLFLPINQNFDYDFPLSNNFFELKVMLNLIIHLAIIIFAIFMYNKNRILSFGILWFYLTLSVESSIIPISDLIMEHRTYLPSYGFFLVLSTVIFTLSGDNYKTFAISLLAVIIGINSYLTYERNKVWIDEYTFWSDVITKSPNKPRPYNRRGFILKETKRYDEMIKDFNKAIEINPRFESAYDNRGTVFFLTNRLDDALKDYNKAIELKPDFAETFEHRGALLIQLKRYKEAIYDYNKLIEMHPDYHEAFMKRGISLYCEKRYDEAIKDYTKTIELKPDYSGAYFNRGLAEFDSGKKEIACQDFQKAIQMGYQSANDLYQQYCR